MANGPYYHVGAYMVEIVEQALGKSSGEKQTPQLALRFRILEALDGAYLSEQYERTMYMYFTEKTLTYVKQNLDQLGFTGGSVTRLDPSHSDHQSFVGQRVEMYCKHEPDQNGQMREKWQLSRGNSGIKVEPLDPREMRQLDALFGKSPVKSTPAPQTPQPVYAGTEISDDDIPF